VDAREDTTLETGLVEIVEVDGRLGAGSARMPVGVADVLTREGARSVPPRSVAELLAPLASVNAADETGNGTQISLDLRGFGGSAGATAVTLDGLRINEPDTNLVAWDLLRVEDLERVEVRPGPQAALGGGSLAGVVHFIRRRPPAMPVLDATVAGGSFDHGELRVFGGGPLGSLRVAASGSSVHDGGFRDGADSRESAGRIAVAATLGSVDLQVDLSHVEGHWSQPGALTKAEMDANPSQSTWNVLDAQDSRQDLLTLRAERSAAPRTSWIAAAGLRDRDGMILTSGLSEYGFVTEDSTRSLSVVFEALSRLDRAGRLALRWGVETSRDRLHPRGFATDTTRDGEIHDLAPALAVDLDWDRGAVFAMLGVDLAKGWRIETGLRHDRAHVRRAGAEVSAATGLMEPVAGSRSFDDSPGQASIAKSLELGGAKGVVHARWAQSFLAPSATQLFAYPGYVGNEGLAAQRGAGPTIGLSVQGAAWSGSVEAFQVDVENEIVYDEILRSNVNAGGTRRRGAQARLTIQAHAKVALSLDAVVTRATFRGEWQVGTNVKPGARVPLVPQHDVALGLDLGPWRGASVRLQARDVGEAALSNDFDGSSRRLPGYRVLDASVSKALSHPRGLSLSLSATNLLDDAHATRGIEVPGGPYFTPAPPRALMLAIGISR
jgi:outer membrane receptor protein involved in Fe transport